MTVHCSIKFSLLLCNMTFISSLKSRDINIYMINSTLLIFHREEYQLTFNFLLLFMREKNKHFIKLFITSSFILKNMDMTVIKHTHI